MICGWLARVHPDDEPAREAHRRLSGRARNGGLRLEYRILLRIGMLHRWKDGCASDEGGNCWGWCAIWMRPCLNWDESSTTPTLTGARGAARSWSLLPTATFRETAATAVKVGSPWSSLFDEGHLRRHVDR